MTGNIPAKSRWKRALRWIGTESGAAGAQRIPVQMGVHRLILTGPEYSVAIGLVARENYSPRSARRARSFAFGGERRVSLHLLARNIPCRLPAGKMHGTNIPLDGSRAGNGRLSPDFSGFHQYYECPALSQSPILCCDLELRHDDSPGISLPNVSIEMPDEED